MSGKKLNLALQGGGSHGAFTWGVLDYLLEDGRLEFKAISGTSAGAMNAVALADGLLSDDPAGGRASLKNLWDDVGRIGGAMKTSSKILDFFTRFSEINHPIYEWWNGFIQHSTKNIPGIPYPNPLEPLLRKDVDYKRIRENKSIKVHISATNIETGTYHIFKTEELIVEHILASAALPPFFQPVVINGSLYWDGGLTCNPPLLPLINEEEDTDILLIQINPLFRKGRPSTSAEILDRLNEISFNGPLVSELMFLCNVISGNSHFSLNTEHNVRIHRIAMSETLDLPNQSRLKSDGPMLQKLYAAGREAGKAWLRKHYDDIGRISTLRFDAHGTPSE